jgi:hypothetical protein
MHINKHKRGKQLVASAMMLGFAASGVALADDEPAKPAPGTLAGVLDASGITVTGYVAASYYHSNGYPSTNGLTSNIHQFDVNHDSFQLDEAGLQIGYQPKEGFGAYVDIIAGDDAKILHNAEDGNSTSFDVRQGYLQYATGPLTIMAGKFVTLAGAEVINPTLNTNYSRSLLFFDSEPLTHTGVRAAYAVNDTLTLTGGLNNGWNTTSTNYGSKTGELAAAWTPNKIFSVASAVYYGKTPGIDGEKFLFDIVGTYNATSSLTFILNFDWDTQDFHTDVSPKSASWNATALYVNYAINDQMRVSVRPEYLFDKDGFVTGYRQTLKEVTVTFGYAPVKSFELRAEVRYDKAQQAPNAGGDFFLRSFNNANETVQYSNSLTGLALQGIYKF